MISNLLAEIPESLEEELFQEILTRSNIKIERIVSRGHHSPEGFWYDQKWEEWVLLIKGKAGIEFRENRAMVELEPGDHLLIPAGRLHRVAWTSPEEETIWLAVHLVDSG